MKQVLMVSPILLSAVLLAAHFLRAGDFVPMLVSLAAPALLLLRYTWVPLVLQSALVIAALEWLRTLIVLAQERQALGAEWTRLALILGGVALLTASSALVFRSRRLRGRYA